MESSDESDDECSSDSKTPQAIYKEHEWGNEDSISEPPTGQNFKSKNEMFAVAATKLKKVYRKIQSKQ